MFNVTETTTKAQLKVELDARGVAYAPKANRDTLVELVCANNSPSTPEETTPTATCTGLKIEKDREERNGIKRPSIGGKCRAIWDAMDAHAESTGDDPTSKDVKAMAAEHGWNPNNASIEFYQWRKFNGIAKGQ